MRTFWTVALIIGAYLVMAMFIRTRGRMSPVAQAITSILFILGMLGVAWIFGLIK